MGTIDTVTRAGFAARVKSLTPALDVLGLPACMLDRDMRYHYVNAAYAAHSGRAAAEFPGKTPDEVFNRTPRDDRRAHLQRALAGHTEIFNRRTLEGPSAGRWMRAHYFPLADAGEVDGILVVLVDIQQLKDAEGALAERERQLSLIMDSIGFPITYVDRGHVIRFANRPSCEWSGRPHEAMVGHAVDEVMTPEVAAAARPLLARALDGESITYEREALWPGREKRHIRGHMIPDRDAAGAVLGVLIVLIDIEQDFQLREALHAKESHLRTFAENIPGPIAVVDREFRYVFANKMFQESRGMPLERIVGRKVKEVLGMQATADFFDPYFERLQRGESCTHERLIELPGREPRWHQVQLAPIMVEGRFNGYYIVSSDIHEIKLAQERLLEQEAQLRLYTDNIPDSVAYLDRSRRILFANRHFAQQRGTTQEEIVGRTSTELMGPETAAWIAERTQKVFDRGEVATYERILTLPDGTKSWTHVKAVPHVDANGAVIGMYVVGHDITDVKQAQEALAAREEELRFFAENIPEAIAYVDFERGCTFVNNVFLESRGFTREFALGKFPEEAYPPETYAEIKPHLERVKRGEETSYERYMPLPSGQERWVRVRLCPRRDSGGRVVGYYAISTDIHEIKLAQAQIEDKERQLRQVIDSIPTPMCYVDADTRYRYVNDAFLEYIGRAAPEIIGESVRNVLGEERWQLMAPYLERVRAGESLTVERLVRFANGTSRWMTVRLTPRIVGSKYLGYFATTSDIHDQKVVEEQLRRAHTILSAHFDNTPLAVIEWDTDLRVARWSGQADAIFGWTAPDMLGRKFSEWRHIYEEDEPLAARMIRDLVEGRTPHATLRHRNYHKDGSVIWVEWHNSALRDASGRVISILSLAQDVSSRIQAEERLQYMATHDGLTGLPNSVLLHDRLESALSRAHRAKTRVGVMFLDLDHFKDVNDTLGHRIGDLLLKELARRIRAALRQSDLLARISGDEFVVVLEDLPDEGSPERVARMILEEVRRPFQVEGNEIHVSGSLGLALHPDDGIDAETLLKNADAAMYHAKELGRNGFRVFSAELASRRTRRMQVETALRRALREGELELHYQPIVELASGEVLRAEALLRWHDPEHGLMLPQGFIPQAEESGLGHALGALGARSRVQAGMRVESRGPARDRVREPLGEPAARRRDGDGLEADPAGSRMRARVAAVRDHRDQHGA